MYLTRSHVPRQPITHGGWPFSLRMASIVILVALVTVARPGPVSGQLVTRGQVAHLGLERAWFAQINLDPSRHRIANWLLQDRVLFAATTGGTIQALDATTGKTLWSTQVGEPRYPTLGPAANQKNVAVVNGSKIILLDRADGRLKSTRFAGAAPSSGPSLSETRVFVALINGRVEAYPIDVDTKQSAWYYQSLGRAYHRPTTTAKSVSWATDLGHLYVGRLDPLKLLFRLETGGEIVASPAAMPPYLLIGSTDGNLYCINEQSGEERWRYITGYSIIKTPAVVGDRVFVTSREPALHVLDATTGQLQWTVAGVTQFVSLGKQHAYGVDRFGNLLAMDIKTGGLVGRLLRGRHLSSDQQDPWSQRGPALVNDQNDRIFLVNSTGLVQCLHEIGLTEPIRYRQPASDSESQAVSTDAQPTDQAEAALQPGDAPSSKSDLAEDNNADDGFSDAEAPKETVPADDPFGDSNPFGE